MSPEVDPVTRNGKKVDHFTPKSTLKLVVSP